MKEYRRFVAYVYEYQKGKKGRNCGFIRVEAREQSCRLEVHLLCPGLTPDVQCEVFGFVRNAGLMDGKLIGSCMTEESRADCVLETDRNSMGGSGAPLEKIGGMVLITENGAFFGTEWDDQPIRPENFRRTENRKREEALVPDRGKRQEEPEAEGKEEVRRKEPEPEEKEEVRQEEPEAEEKAEVRQEEPEAEVGQKEPEAEEKAEIRQEEPEVKTEVKQEDPEIEKEPYTEQARDGEQNKEEETEPEVKAQAVSSFSQLLSVGEPVEAFADGEIYDCRKIQLRDLAVLYPRDCSLRNNRFVQHGQYHFGHLLLGRNRLGQYILGVPGGYDQQERFMANMFGFPYFRESRQIRLPRARGGYWYRLINSPKLYERDGAFQNIAEIH